MSFFRRVAFTGIAATFGLSTAAIAAGTCATRSGPVPTGASSVGACIGATHLGCPARGPVFECRDGRWFCVKSTNYAASPPQPCTADMSGPWVWTNEQGLHWTTP